jgi:toxin ParE1/3/4
MKVYWTDNALEQIRSIHSYISKSSPLYAKRVIDRLTKRSRQIGDFPLSGRVVPEYEMAQIREVIEGHYRIIYFIKPDEIDVLAVIHSAQQIGRNP